MLDILYAVSIILAVVFNHKAKKRILNDPEEKRDYFTQFYIEKKRYTEKEWKLQKLSYFMFFIAFVSILLRFAV